MKNNKTSNKNNTNNNSNLPTGLKIDGSDVKIIELMLACHNTNYISNKIRMPLSTVQRRIRRLYEKELLLQKVELNYEKLGYKRGYLHVYSSNGEVDEIGLAMAAKPGVLSVAVHIGNSDLVGLFIYKDSKQLLDILSETKQIDGVEKALWSEEVYFLPINEDKFNILNI
jgi:DNA-binding Lrp family transcriptional regulator